MVYSLPVDSGFMSTSISFLIGDDDLAVLLSDPYRRAILEVVAHEVLQSSMGRGNPDMTPIAFGRLVADILHSTPEDLGAFVAAISSRHNVAVAVLVDQVTARRNLAADQ